MKRRDLFKKLGAVSLLAVALISCNKGKSKTAPTRDDPTQTGTASRGAITREEVWAYFQKQLKNNADSYDYRNPTVTIERFQQYPSKKYGENTVAYPVSIDMTQSYESYSGKRINHFKNEYDVFARNVDTGEWEIIQGKAGEITTEDVPASD